MCKNILVISLCCHGFCFRFAQEVILLIAPVASDAFLSFCATIFSHFGGGFTLKIHRQYETRQVITLYMFLLLIYSFIHCAVYCSLADGVRFVCSCWLAVSYSRRE